MGMIALGIMSVDPGSQLLLGNHLFGSPGNKSDNLVVGSLNYNGSVSSYDWNPTVFDSLSAPENSLLSTVASAFPDWIRAGWHFMTNVGRDFINLVGAPSIIFYGLGLPPDLAGLIASFFGIFATFVMLNWLLGRDT
jgi:hypothetical protein